MLVMKLKLPDSFRELDVNMVTTCNSSFEDKRGLDNIKIISIFGMKPNEQESLSFSMTRDISLKQSKSIFGKIDIT